MRPASDMPRFRPRAPGRGRVIVIVIAVVLFLLITSLRQIAEVWTDYLWFDSLEFSAVWTTTWAIKLGLGLFFTAVLVAILWLNLAIADRVSPAFRPIGPEEELLSRYHDFVDRRAGTLRIIVALVFGVITGAGMSGQWNDWVLYSNAQDFGTVDPQFGIDIGFYIFKLPFLTAVVDWAFASMVIVLLVTAVAHYLNGGIRLQSPLERVTPQVKAHLSVLLAVLALIKAADYYLQRYQVLFSSRGTVDGATNTEVNATLPGLYLLLFIALGSFVLFIVNIRRRGWVLPIVAVGIWVFVQLLVGGVYPAFYQRFFVQPEESTKEAPYIQNNIDATRRAYGLENIVEKDFTLSSEVADGVKAINTNPAITRNVQLLDPDRLLDTFQLRESLEAPLQFTRVATDRYSMEMPDGSKAETQVILSTRDINANQVPQKSWQAEKLTYTHGYGLALAAGNAVAPDGAPKFSVSGIPLKNDDSIDLTTSQPNNYYFNTPILNSQQALPDYSVVDSGSPEFDYERKAQNADKSYAGAGGVPIDSFFRKAAYWLRFGNFDLMISQYVNEQSRILYMRDIRQRALTAAPFLAFDSNPYPAVVDGRTVYILDAYTTSDMYPNSEHYPNDGGDSPLLRHRSFNYVRNSVKAVIDAYDGSVKFYVVDKTDPIIAAYRSAFPELFHDSNEISSDPVNRTGLKEHLRYPEDIFTVQTDLWGRYHIDDPSRFYNREGAWEPPPQPPIQPTNTAPAPAPSLASAGAAAVTPSAPIKLDRMAPYYVLNKLQGGDVEPNFMLMRAYQPFSENDSKNQLASFMVARSDAQLGTLETFEMPAQTVGPSLVGSQFQSDARVSQQITLLGQSGSQVVFGDLLIVPIDKTIVYVRTFFVVSERQPLVRFVLLYANGKVYLQPTLRAALTEAFPGSNPATLEAANLNTAVEVQDPNAPATTTTTTTPSSTTTTVTVPGSTAPPVTVPADSDAGVLIAQADRAFAEADAALKNGDLVTYAEKIKVAEDAVKKAQALITASQTTTTAVSTPPT